MKDLKKVTIRFPEELIEALKELKTKGFNVSEFCRQAIMEKLKNIKKAS